MGPASPARSKHSSTSSPLANGLAPLWLMYVTPSLRYPVAVVRLVSEKVIHFVASFLLTTRMFPLTVLVLASKVSRLPVCVVPA